MSGSIKKSGGELALLGGKPIFAKRPQVTWPPTDQATARELSKVYLSSRWSFNDKHEQAFAAAFAKYHGARHGILMVNGTVTLEAILACLDVGPGDEVIVPALTWMATAMVVRYVGAKPVFVDVEPTTLCLDATKLEAARTPRTRAVIPVHLYGGMADLEAIGAWAKKHDIAMIEDCAHMHGGVWNGRGAGSWGIAGSFSFQQSKPMASGEGGICLTSDDKLAERLFRYKHIGYAQGSMQGKSASGPPAGLICRNYRATEFQAVILRHQLKGLRSRIRTYNSSASRLEKHIKSVKELGLRPQSRGRLANPQGYYRFIALADGGPLAEVPIDILYKAMNAEGIGVDGTYGPVYHHKLWNLDKRHYRISGGRCPVAEETAARSLCLSHAYLGLRLPEIDRIGDVLVKVARGADKLRMMRR